MTVGIVGAGQLGRMLALAGYPLGLDFRFLDRAADTPGGQVAPILVGEFTDSTLLRRLARGTRVVTFDWENVPVAPLRALAGRARLAPPLPALAAAQDRLAEKRLFAKLAVPTNASAAVDSARDLARAFARIGPGVLKTRRLGYDGKGQFRVRSARDLDAAWAALGGAPLIYEQFVPFDYEVSIIGARSARGEIAVYPLNGNVHVDGILRVTRAPFGTPALARAAARYLKRVLEHFRYTGVLAIEFFVKDGRLLANEMAPRVHNSGHWTIEGAQTSQFENHLRAILGLPLGSTRARGHAAMVNLIGELPPLATALSEPGLHWHDYGKSARPGRKVGHCTLVEASAGSRDRRVRALLPRLAPGVRVSFPRL
ncbi:MAG TPA: 5-(carboxyamino)imidazole ribonucleotide synthase [Steroidobacteraceae bacterium]|nr:5-(carboxyamino)imidazole ribonucleotide synthase [Steroidobacteraceae bacterium]HNS28643.1 5-(carboxyamino)imidazole ribonucleotide synthase [Steroidobacteraceae bacterium]